MSLVSHPATLVLFYSAQIMCRINKAVNLLLFVHELRLPQELRHRGAYFMLMRWAVSCFSACNTF